MIKNVILTSFVLLAVLTANAQQSALKFKSIKDFQAFFQWSAKRYPLISAHRGGPVSGFPENAIETFANSYKHHPVIIECDVALSSDSVMVMMHDDKLERTTNGSGPIGKRSYEELKALRLKDNEGMLTPFHIPTLDQVLDWGRDKVIYTIDVKRGVPYQKIIEAVRKNKAERYSVIITYSATQAAEVHRMAPEMMISASIRSNSDLERLNQLGVPNNRIVAFVGTAAPDQSIYNLLHDKKIWCILGTMGNLDKSAATNGDQLYQTLVEKGADILSSDRSMESADVLMKYSHKNGLHTKHLSTKK